MEVTQRNQTRNQSTADYKRSELFVFDNRFASGTFKNNAAPPFTLTGGMLVARDLATPNGVIPATAGNLESVVGISAETLPVLAQNATAPVTYGTKGTVVLNSIVLPAGVTLATTVGTVTLRDYLEGLGFHLEDIVENTKIEE